MVTRKLITTKSLVTLTLIALASGFSQNAAASAFQLFEQNAVNMGDFGAGGAAIAEDASTAFYNPAGLVRLRNRQLVVSGDVVNTDFKFNGTATWSSTLPPPFGPPPFTQVGNDVQGGHANFIPAFHYAAPMCDRLVLGFSVGAPFGLDTNYAPNGALRYAATETNLQTYDFSPSFGFKVNEHFSFGAGFDAVHLIATFNSMAGIPSLPPSPMFLDTQSSNTASGWGYGWHAGLLFQFCPGTRVGLAYRSQLNFALHGTSTFIGPLAAVAQGEPPTERNATLVSDNLRSSATLPPATTFSIYHDINRCWAVDGSVVYTQWDKFNDILTLRNVQAVTIGPLGNFIPVKIDVSIPQHFSNTWRVALGAVYHPVKPFLIRFAVGYDQTPTNNTDRNIRLPDGDRYAVAVGAHYQISRPIGIDVGWTHLFIDNVRVDNTAIEGIQAATVHGRFVSHADLVGAQISWDFC